MKLRIPQAWRVAVLALSLCSIGLLLSPSPAAAQLKYVVGSRSPQKKIKQLPAGPLYWRVENFPTLADAKAAVATDGWNPASVSYETTTSLIAEVAGKVAGGHAGRQGCRDARRQQARRDRTGTADHRARIFAAPQLWIRPSRRQDSGAFPSGIQIFLRGRRPPRPKDATRRELCRCRPYHEWAERSGVTMAVFNAGKTELTALIMFVVDAGKPFSVPAKFE